MTAPSPDQAELEALRATLTPEELEAIDGNNDTEPADVEALKAIAAGAADDDGDDDEEEAADDAPPQEGKTAAETGDEVKPDEQPAAAPAPAEAASDEDEDAPPPPVFSFKLPDDFEQQVADNRAAKAAVYQRLKDGEITIDDLPNEIEALNEKARELDSMRTKAEVAEQAAEQSAKAYQRREIDRAFKAAKADGIDYKGKDADKIADLDMFMKALAGKQENADKPYKWFLAEAHKRVAAMHGVKAPAPAPAPAADPAKPKPAARKAPVSEAPPSLANVPGGDGPGDVGGEFDDILSLEGEAMERALAEMQRRDPARFARFESAR
jgi:hypothetical protein